MVTAVVLAAVVGLGGRNGDGGGGSGIYFVKGGEVRMERPTRFHTEMLRIHCSGLAWFCWCWVWLALVGRLSGVLHAVEIFFD